MRARREVVPPDKENIISETVKIVITPKGPKDSRSGRWGCTLDSRGQKVDGEQANGDAAETIKAGGTAKLPEMQG